MVLRLTDENHTVAGFVKDSFLHTPGDSTGNSSGPAGGGTRVETRCLIDRVPRQRTSPGGFPLSAFEVRGSLLEEQRLPLAL